MFLAILDSPKYCLSWSEYPVWTEQWRPSMRYQFRLKTLLSLVLGIALILASYVWYTHVPPGNRPAG